MPHYLVKVPCYHTGEDKTVTTPIDMNARDEPAALFIAKDVMETKTPWLQCDWDKASVTEFGVAMRKLPRSERAAQRKIEKELEKRKEEAIKEFREEGE